MVWCLETAPESRAAARLEVVPVDERFKLAVDRFFDRLVDGAVDVFEEGLHDQVLDVGPEPLVGIARDRRRVLDLELGEVRGRDGAARIAARKTRRERALGLGVRRRTRLRAQIDGVRLESASEGSGTLALEVQIAERQLDLSSRRQLRRHREGGGERARRAVGRRAGGVVRVDGHAVYVDRVQHELVQALHLGEVQIDE
mmetsp:Transcript_20923/g.64383  ORF Transcript_20923/g.64383 Transcript_20923/m.64383 type:complete len:200 (+) Transcript_20923:97-696(+)